MVCYTSWGAHLWLIICLCTMSAYCRWIWLWGLTGLPPGRDWLPRICVLWCSSTWTPSTSNNLWKCTPAAQRPGKALWKDAPWSGHRNPHVVCCWEAWHLEPTCSSTSKKMKPLDDHGKVKREYFFFEIMCNHLSHLEVHKSHMWP